jgi:sigma-B regulation protein RsbU (phosphoserine phosphatase)
VAPFSHTSALRRDNIEERTGREIMKSEPNDLRMLIVDDSPMVLNFATHVLGRLGIPITTAADGREGLEKMRDLAADILITDLMMPEMDGFELIERVREDDRFARTHIIVMTALEQVEDKVRALQLGANDYTVKPLDANEFRARVQAGIREMRLKKQLMHVLDSLDREMKLVAHLQRRLLPKSLPQSESYQTAAYYLPWSQAGGDYYDCFIDKHGRLVVSVADVSGHGASAAVLMGMFRALLKHMVAEGSSAADLVSRLNEALLDNIGDDPDFITSFIAFVEPEKGRLNYCAAGHGGMVLLGPEKGSLEYLPAGGTVLGSFDGPWEDSTALFAPGAFLVLFTDGLLEAEGLDSEQFGRPRLERVLREFDPTDHPQELVDRMEKSVKEFVGDRDLGDDLTIFVLKLL